MRIIFIGGRSYYGNPDAGDNYDYLHVAASLGDMGHGVTFLDYFAGDDINDQLRTAWKAQPADMLIYMAFEDELDTKALGKLDCPKILLLSDDSWRRDYGLELAQHFDYVLANAPDSADAYQDKFVSWQWGARPALYRRNANRPIQAIFIGQAYGDRPKLVEALRDAGVRVETRGKGWPEGEIRGNDIPVLMQQALIGINFNRSSRNSKVLQIKARNFEIPAAGCCPLLEYAPGLDGYYTHGTEAVFFSNETELIDRAVQLAKDPATCQAIASAAWQRTMRHHTYQQRWRVLFDRIANA